jgi:hypothetical protein
MKLKKIYLPLLAALSLLGGGARLWNMKSAIDSQGLFVEGHPSTYLLAGLSLVAVLLLLLLSARSPGRSGEGSVLYGNSPVSIAAGVLLLLGVLLEFVEALVSGPGLSAPILCLLGIVAGICLLVVAVGRKQGKSFHPCFDLLPVLYLLIRLILNFKSWSTDPIILDYCFLLFALIFSLLGFYHSAGFCFHQGKPRKALFYASAGIYFSLMAAVDGIVDGSIATAAIYLSLLLWLWPIVSRLLVPREAPKVEQPPEVEEDPNNT